jgi:hypothetical protein
LVRGDAARGEVIGQIELHRIARQIVILRELKILDRPLTAEAVATKEFLPATRR